MFFGIESRLCSSGDAGAAEDAVAEVADAAAAVVDRGAAGDAVADLAVADIAEVLAAVAAVVAADVRRFAVAGRVAASYRSLLA